MSHPRFHLAIPVDDLAAASEFYGVTLGCPPGRRAANWADWDLYGHQLVTHVAPAGRGLDGRGDGNTAVRNPVDGHDVPVPHFGVLLSVDDFHALATRLADAGTEFVIDPYLRFEGEAGEQWTMFLRDPAGNNLEFKAFADDDFVFAT